MIEDDDIDTLRKKVRLAGTFLQAVAHGYAAHGAEDQFACVENPEATAENVALRGTSDFIVIDIQEFLGLEDEDPPDETETAFP